MLEHVNKQLAVQNPFTVDLRAFPGFEQEVNKVLTKCRTSSYYENSPSKPKTGSWSFVQRTQKALEALVLLLLCHFRTPLSLLQGNARKSNTEAVLKRRVELAAFHTWHRECLLYSQRKQDEEDERHRVRDCFLLLPLISRR